MVNSSLRTIITSLKIPVATLAVTLASLQFPEGSGSAEAQDPFASFPVVITCEYKGTYHAFYLSRVSKDGTATFVASDRIAGTITLNGQAKAVGGSDGGTCLGKTLKELRASGQAHDLKS
ncbi:hypothetical protein [Rhizobium mesoamericanum]|uniref:Uncharacterized protein n=1 Tax=Rhizobium mesoamericanum STM3625 TaxID=1211777 RepID=K0Q1W8_9HYPH|nr:hypothetical protein [Rhizobium mesoamericanum]CCM76439.1 conserved exported hypothetical protein [Rhizobium mesoamericanum STM3625]